MLNVVSNQLKQLIIVSYYESLDSCAKQLDVKINAMREYVSYLEEKRYQIFNLIEKYTIELDNKYIDRIEDFKIAYANKIDDHDLVWLQEQINKLESDSAKIDEAIQCTLKQIANAIAERTMLSEMNSLL
ncbi:hypothetical protein [Mammaliicoccus stepanovicii]|nr:hypothetical protein [Mammaliicoccus stepanovicii]PNZ73526.1 hypothetical protein CD111_09880 [Mammaliicoccus stepanovicii]GGI42272.1 hypothetical protein GCM10010896_17580 [Mammaliicoccus stepanovicii]CPN55329.1 Uncharacterised protein [Staphylococcus aureus]